MKTIDIFQLAIEKKASDIFIIAGRPLSFKIMGDIVSYDDIQLSADDTYGIIYDIFKVANQESLDELSTEGDVDFSFSLPKLGRFRVSAYKQRNSFAAVIRVVLFELPDPVKLGIPDVVMNLHSKTKGLILITGPAGSGKSTTLACLIDKINTERNCHIMTFEDPIEYIHKHKRSIVSQREISTDSKSYISSLRSSLRQAPDVMLIGEMRDLETIEIALTAAETGHLVLSTLHTTGAANTIDRIIDVFPSNQQQQVRIQLSMQLQAVISQHLIPSPVRGRAAAFEVMLATNAVSNLIRESKVHQLNSVIYSSEGKGMKSMDTSIYELYKNGIISKENAVLHSIDPDLMLKLLNKQ
ncbi:MULTISPECIES: type IV pilus twitching motility protein PilT [Sedimentibacter]|uniref:type IV pilus twitching motility protein PilT n=1 Tax=Sedimentibacter TaxID=190972 RepID=UPI000307B611|nr:MULTISPECIES: PilT/PilU family type 4a pilus ATPase [Sedimentibacter]MEA5094068.1 PilT/PilU family type 4a pilus ATPase [Sedimentibacter saalensis]